MAEKSHASEVLLRPKNMAVVVGTNSSNNGASNCPICDELILAPLEAYSVLGRLLCSSSCVAAFRKLQPKCVNKSTISRSFYTGGQAAF